MVLCRHEAVGSIVEDGSMHIRAAYEIRESAYIALWLASVKLLFTFGTYSITARSCVPYRGILVYS
jgi:hypothetical protein